MDNIKKDFGMTKDRKPVISSMVYGKVPPQAPELESAVLGALMSEKDALDTVIDIIPSEDYFYVDANQKVYKAILAIYRSGGTVDMLTVSEQLKKQNDLEIVGGAYYLAQLTMGVVSAAHIEAHALIIVEKYLQRDLIRITGQAIGDAYEDTTDVFDLMGRIDTELAELQNAIPAGESLHVGIASKEFAEEMEQKRIDKVTQTGIPTGLSELDSVIDGGWQATDLIILAARPAVGKTAFELFISDAAANNGYPVAIYSLEMVTKQLIRRMVQAKSGIEGYKIKKPFLMNEQEWLKYQWALGEVAKLPIYIDDKSGLTIRQLRASARKLKKKKGIKLIVVDYLQLMEGEGRNGNREEEISKISRGLKGIAKELEVTVIALSQLNRTADGQKPKLSHLRESGAIEQDADGVLLLSGPTKEDEEKDPSLKGVRTIDVAKFRHGDTREIIVYFEKETQRWFESKPDSFFSPPPEPAHKTFERLRNQSEPYKDTNPF